MKKRNSKDVVLGMLIMALVLGLAVSAVATSSKTLQPDYMNIKLVVDGKFLTTHVTEGKVPEPFAVDGTTYLPLRAVAEAMEKKVKWDGSTHTVYIDDIPTEVIGLGDEEKQLLDAVWESGNAKDIAKLPNTKKALEEFCEEGEYGSDGNNLYFHPKDITSTYTVSMRQIDGGAKNQIVIPCGESTAQAAREDYCLKIAKAILFDVVPDEADAQAIYDTLIERDRLGRVMATAQFGSEEYKAALAALSEIGYQQEYGAVTTEWDGMDRVLMVTRK